MHVQCPQCGVGGNIPDEKIPEAGRNILCPKCKVSFFVQKEPTSAVVDTEIPEQNATTYYNEGVQLLKAKQVDAAIEKFNSAIRITPQYSEAYRYLGLAYGQKNLWQEASDVLQKAIEYKPDDLLSLKNLGVAYLRQKQFSEAEQTLLKALQYAPGDKKAQSYLVMAARGVQQEQQKQQASKNQEQQEKERVLGMDSSPSEPLMPPPPSPVQEFLDKGVEFLDNAQHNKAVEAFQEAIRLSPTSSDGYFGLGLVYEKNQEWAKAIEMYEKAVDVNPNDSVARENLRFAKKQKKKFKFPWQK